MNIDSTKIKTTQPEKSNLKNNNSQNEGQVKFSDELEELKKTEKNEKLEKSSKDEQKEQKKTEENNKSDENTKQEEDTKTALNDLKQVINELNQSDDKTKNSLKYNRLLTDNDNNKGNNLINNDFNIEEQKNKLPQMGSNMNFGGDGQPFSSFMNSETVLNNEQKLSLNTKDLEEEKAILSTMAENIAMANKINMASEKNDEPKEKIIQRNDGIKKIDKETGITKEIVVKYDTVIMNEADVEVFTNLVDKGEVNLSNLSPEAAQKSVHVSKTLADMLAKAMEDNKPVRIEFDNGISVIIKISRDGKLSADFLPSTQIAEAYLKENLPLLKQRFDEQNIDYNELNQRERKNQDKEQQRKKGSDNE